MALNLTLRKSFLYIFATVGLVLCIVGLTSLINLGLRSYVFTKSDYPCSYNRPYSEVKPIPANNGQPAISVEEQEKQNRQAEQNCIESRTSEKQRQASNAIAMLIVGLPLYGYHWMTIRKENQV